MKDIVLIILDGLGASAINEGNAVLSSKTPFLDVCWKNYPKTLLSASGEEVGLPWGEMGNSEVGHLNIGTGKISMQDLPRINHAIKEGTFFENEYLIDACRWTKKYNSKLHLMGLLSNGGVHADYKHIMALIDLAKKNNVEKLYIHLFTDGRDMPKKSAKILLDDIDKEIKKEKLGKIATLIGRYYAMDRDKNWERTQKAYQLISEAKGKIYDSYQKALDENYKNSKDDESIESCVLDKNGTIDDNDAIIFFNFRSDRARQLSESFISLNFNKFQRNKFAKNVRFISFVSYGNEQTPLVDVAYISEVANGQLAETISKANMSQLHIAETEKYAHVTHFFNGGIEKAFNKEERIITPSPKVSSYDLKPEMSAGDVTDKFIKYVNDKKPNFTVINFANPDMVGHTGNYKATIKAIEAVDKCLEKISKNLFGKNYSLLITADHGNAEQMINLQTKEIDKQHTTNAVPFVMIEDVDTIKNNINNKLSLDEKIQFFSQNPTGVIADISPTIIDMAGINKSSNMTGISLKNII